SLWRTPALPFVVRPAQQLWTSANGPGGGFVTALHQQGTRLWAGVSNGRVFSSTNGGRMWQAMPSLEGSASKFVTAGNFLYADASGTVFRLDLNSPAGWSRMVFAEGPVFLGTLGGLRGLTAKGSSVFAIFGDKLFRLDAEATFWKLVNDKFAENLDLSGMEAAGNGNTDPLYVLASLVTRVENPGVITSEIKSLLLVSNDEGKNWRRITLTIPPLVSRLESATISRLHLVNRRPYFASTDGIFRLDDREQIVRVGNASDRTGNAPANAIAMAWDSDTLYAAVREFAYSSLGFDGLPPQVFRLEGDQWVAADTGLNPRYLQSLVATANGLFVGTAKGIWHSGNRGDLWTERNQGLNATSVFLMTTSGNALYAASDAGLHRTVNNGQTWTRADHGLPTDALFGFGSSGSTVPIGRFSTWINALAANGNTLYAALPTGIYRSTDQGQSWRNTGLVEYTTSSFAFAGAQVLAGSYKGLFSPLATTQPGGGGLGLSPPVDFGVYRSPNGTGSWQINDSSLFGDSVVALTTLSNKVFAATSRSGIRVSDDNGLTWRDSSNGLDATPLYSLVTVNNVLLAAAHSGVYRSTDQGQTWRATNAPGGTFTALVAQGATVFGLSFGEVYRSNNFGETWVQLPTAYVDQITGGTSNSLFCLQPLGDFLFVGTAGDGVLVANLAPTRAAAVNAASYAGGELAPNSIATIFGSNLATGTQIAPGDNLPEELLGTRVVVRSSRGVEQTAKLFFVSPGQINFLIPFLSPDAIPTQIFVTTASGQQSLAEVRITDTALGLFAANGNGQGVPAAVALRVKADGAQSYEPVFRFDTAQNRFTAIPLDVSATNGTLFLVLYGTGIDQATKLEQVSATIDGQATRVLYAGPQGDGGGYALSIAVGGEQT
ncbi:MAG: hypothetical protein HOP19_27555, partial [Acidobacteria bacterium]|nr:hypothetical protein [Acidobacteriota bacterium]